MTYSSRLFGTLLDAVLVPRVPRGIKGLGFQPECVAERQSVRCSFCKPLVGGSSPSAGIKSQTFPSRKDAQARATSIETAIREGRHFPHAAAKRTTFDALAED